MLPVHSSSSRLVWAFVPVFGLVPPFGFMPSGHKPLSLASSAWWSSPPPSSNPPRWRQGEGSGSGDSPINKLEVEVEQVVGSSLLLAPGRRGGGRACRGRFSSVLLCRYCSSLDPSFQRGWPRSLVLRRSTSSSAAVYTLDLEKKRMKDGDAAVGDRELQGRWFRWIYGALGWLPISDEPSYFLVERRPNLFLPAMMPKGRQFASGWSPRQAAVEVSSDQVVPSPAPAKLVPLGSNFGPDCIFASLFRVLFESSRDLCVVSIFCQGPVVRCFVTAC